LDEQHLIYLSTWQALQPDSRQGRKEFEKDPGEVKGRKTGRKLQQRRDECIL